ncbi:MAG: topoisomerase DNA-binding C4 zinc finger domain-containing protein [Vicinamibacteraceae bacterium]
MITTGHYTSAARDWALGKPIELWGAEQLAVAPLPTATPARAAVADPGRCPSCGSALMSRTNRRTRETFIGCASYPRCRFTRPS